MVVILKKELDVSAKWRSLVLAIMLCCSVVIAGWAAYLVGEDAPGQPSSPGNLLVRIDGKSTSRFLLSDNHGQSPVLQVRELSSRAPQNGQVSLALPRAEVSGLPRPPRPVLLDLGPARPNLEPIDVYQQASRPDRTDEIVASIRQRMKLGKVEIQAAEDVDAVLFQPPVIVAAVYEQSMPADNPVEPPGASIFTLLGSQLPTIELPRINLPVPAVFEGTSRGASSTPHLPWRLSGGKGK